MWFSSVILHLIKDDESLLQASWSILRWAGKPQPYRSSQCFSGVPVPWCEAAICGSNHQSEGRGLSFFYNLSLLNFVITACGSYYQRIVDVFQFRVHKLFANNLELCKSRNTMLELFRQLWIAACWLWKEKALWAPFWAKQPKINTVEWVWAIALLAFTDCHQE